MALAAPLLAQNVQTEETDAQLVWNLVGSSKQHWEIPDPFELDSESPWNLAAPKLDFQLQMSSLAFDDGVLWSATEEGPVFLKIKVSGDGPVFPAQGLEVERHEYEGLAIATGADGKQIYSLEENGTIRSWTIDNLRVTEEKIPRSSFSHQNGWEGIAAVPTAQGHHDLWLANEGRRLVRLERHKGKWAQSRWKIDLEELLGESSARLCALEWVPGSRQLLALASLLASGVSKHWLLEIDLDQLPEPNTASLKGPPSVRNIGLIPEFIDGASPQPNWEGLAYQAADDGLSASIYLISDDAWDDRKWVRDRLPPLARESKNFGPTFLARLGLEKIPLR